MNDGRYKVKLRRGNNFKVKPEAEQTDGKVYEFLTGWIMDKEDTRIYIGETTMHPHDETYPKDAPSWIASGDLEEVS